jgi:hypothetical protein
MRFRLGSGVVFWPAIGFSHLVSAHKNHCPSGNLHSHLCPPLHSFLADHGLAASSRHVLSARFLAFAESQQSRETLLAEGFPHPQRTHETTFTITKILLFWDFVNPIPKTRQRRVFDFK